VSDDETLAGRVRRLLKDRRGAAEREMFGGLAFLLDGRMRLGLAKPHVRSMDVTGRPLTGADASARRYEDFATCLAVEIAALTPFVSLIFLTRAFSIGFNCRM